MKVEKTIIDTMKRFNINRVECKSYKNTGLTPVILSFNINRVECKSGLTINSVR